MLELGLRLGRQHAHDIVYDAAQTAVLEDRAFGDLLAADPRVTAHLDAGAIAGLLEKTSTNGTNGLPYLGEDPVLGALFRSNNFQQGESELVIIVTPYLVSPASSPSVFHLPTDGFKPATDLDRILLGRQMSQASTGSRALDAGFILK